MGSQKESSLFCLPIDENLAKLDGATALKKKTHPLEEEGKATQSRRYNIRKACFYLFYLPFFLVYGHTQDTLNTLRSLDREFYVSGEERAE